MNIDLYSLTGTKKGTLALSKELFGGPVNTGLMHQFLVLQQSNRRAPVSHSKTRGDIQGSTRKLFAQKGTGRARRGPIRSPILRGGSKAFGPKSVRNYTKDMPRNMRRSALKSCLAYQAKKGHILGLEKAPDFAKTKEMFALLSKLPVDIGRHILLVLPESNQKASRTIRNIAGAKAITVNYLNPEDLLRAQHVIFVKAALEKAKEIFGKEAKGNKTTNETEVSPRSTLHAPR
jgi:large subunit ribosomal protein L4